MLKITKVQSTVIRPAVYNLEGGLGWGWSKASEICQITKLSLTELFRRYAKLSKDADKGVLTVWTPMGLRNAQIEELINLEEDLSHLDISIPAQDFLYVPTGWANDVIAEVIGTARRERQNRVRELFTKGLENVLRQLPKNPGIVRYVQEHISEHIAQGIVNRLKINSHIAVEKVHCNTWADDTKEYALVFYDLRHFKVQFVEYGQHFSKDMQSLPHNAIPAQIGAAVVGNASVYLVPIN